MTKTKEQIQEEINKLEEELSVLKKTEKAKIIQDHQWLVGICLSTAWTSMERIIAITNIIFQGNKAKKIELEVVSVYYYKDGDDDKSTKIDISNYLEIDIEKVKEYIDEYSRPLAEFNDFFNNAVNAIKNL